MPVRSVTAAYLYTVAYLDRHVDVTVFSCEWDEQMKLTNNNILYRSWIRARILIGRNRQKPIGLSAM